MRRIDFCFYPRHEYACPHVSHCPHLGGAALSTLVDAASEQGDYLDMLHGQLDFERERNAKLVAENERLERELAQAKLELKLERQRKFACGRDAKDDTAVATPHAAEGKAPRRRGAPVGHPGWFRPTPTEYDRIVLVAAPAKCPHCTGEVRAFPKYEPHDHLQEDVVGNVHQVVLYRHAAGRCRDCRRWVRQAGPGEILGSRIGPRMRALAIYLRNNISVSYRKVPRALEDAFGDAIPAASLQRPLIFPRRAGQDRAIVMADLDPFSGRSMPSGRRLSLQNADWSLASVSTARRSLLRIAEAERASTTNSRRARRQCLAIVPIDGAELPRRPARVRAERWRD